MENKAELYKKLSEVYRKLSLESFSLSFGEALLSYLKDNSIPVRKGIDLCCGTGDLCRYFSEHGIEMTGVDLSPEMIAIAKTAAPGCRFLCEDVSELPDGLQADFVTCMDDSINHITSKESLAAIFDSVWELLPEGGIFAFDIVDPDALTVGETYSVAGMDGYTGEYTIREDENTGMLNIILRVFENGKERLSVTSEERIYERNEIWEMLMDSGFTMPVCTTEFYNEKTGLKYKIIAAKV